MIKNNLTKLIIILVLILAIVLILTKDKEPEIKTVTKTEYIRVTDDKIDTKPAQVSTQIIKVPVPVTNYVTKTDTIYKDVETQKYVFKDTLDNGIIESTIYSDLIHKRDVKLTTFNKETTTTITKTKYVSSFFVGVSANTNFNTSIEQLSVNLYYVHKNKFILGTGIGNDFVTDKPISNITFAIKF